MPTGDRPDPPQGTIRAAISGINSPNSRWANVFWVRGPSSGSPGGTELNVVAEQLYGFWNANFNEHLSTECVMEGCQVLYYGAGGARLGGQHIENVAGRNIGTALPAHAALVISWHIQQRYRGGHPRTYLPGLTNLHPEDPTSWSLPTRDTFAGAANNFHNQVNGMVVPPFTDFHLGTVSFVLDREWRTTPTFRDFTPTAATVDTRIDSQRRRLGRDR